MTRVVLLICLSILLIDCGKSQKNECAISPYESDLLLSDFFDTGDSTKLNQLIESTNNILENNVVVNKLFVNRLVALSQKGKLDEAIAELNSFLNSPQYSEKFDIGYADLINVLHARKAYLANNSVKAQSYLRKSIERYDKKINWSDFVNQLEHLDDDTKLPFNADEENFIKYLVMVSIIDHEAATVEINKILKKCPNAKMRAYQWESYIDFFNPFTTFLSTREDLQSNLVVQTIVEDTIVIENEDQ